MGDIVLINNVKDVFNNLSDSLSEKIVSPNLMYILMLLIGMLIIWRCVRHVFKKSLSWWLAFFLFLEIMHVISYNTVLGEWIPFVKTVFKYDILTIFAQMCVGTKVSEALLWIQAYINVIIGGAFKTIFHWIVLLFNFIKQQAY